MMFSNVLLLAAACVATVTGAAHELDCEGTEAMACSECVCMIDQSCDEETTETCTPKLAVCMAYKGCSGRGRLDGGDAAATAAAAVAVNRAAREELRGYDDDDWTPFEDSYDETEACLAATGHCAETQYDAGWEIAVACVDAEYRKDPTLKEQCCAYCDALARCAEGRTTILEYDDDGYYSTRADNCKESKMCDSGDDGNDNDIAWFDNEITSDSRSTTVTTTEPYCNTTGVEVSCSFLKLQKVPIFRNRDVTKIDLSWNGITELVANVFEGLSSLVSLDLSENGITELVANAFEGLSSLVSLDLSENGITKVAANALAGLPSLTTLDLGSCMRCAAHYNRNALMQIAIATNSFAGLDNLTSFPYFKLGTEESKQAAIAFCSNATTQIPPLAVASTAFCIGYSTVSPEEIMFLAISVSVSAFVGLLVLVQLCRKKGSGGITCWDVLHVIFFSFRICDLFTDFGVYGFTAKKVFWDVVMNNEGYVTDKYTEDERNVIGEPYTNDDFATPVKYVSLISAIIGAVLFVPDIFVYAHKLGLNKDGGGGGFFNLYNPSQKAAIVIMSSTLLLESIPQLVCAIMIIQMYIDKTDISLVTIPIVSVALTCTTLLTDSFFLFKLCFGRCCCSCCCACCHCDVSDLFEDDAVTGGGQGTINRAYRGNSFV